MDDPPADAAAPDAPDPRGPTLPGATVLKLGAALGVVVLGVTLAGAALIPGWIRARGLAQRSACAQTLRALGAAAAQYAQDQGAFPHVRGAGELDGGVETADGPRAWRKLLRTGLLADPAALLCPSAPRRQLPRQQRAAQRRWLTSTAPDGPGDPTLFEFEELSYGWTRRALGPNAPAATPLAADKAVLPRGWEPDVETIVGNHVDGWNLLRRDGAVEWLGVEREPFPGTTLARTEDPARDGFLGIRDQPDPARFRRD